MSSPSGPDSAFPQSDTILANRGYTLIKRIGIGAYGEVWKAVGPGAVEVAIKITPAPLDGADARELLQQLERVKRLRHPFLLATHAYFAVNDRLITVMELAEENLQTRLSQCLRAGLPGIPRPELMRYMTEASKALDYLHENQILHRDVKPSNVMLIAGHAKVSDFGLVRQQAPMLSRSGELLGTPQYMAPEAIRGSPNPRSDQYALAATYVELRANRPLFPAASQMEMLMHHTISEPDLSVLPIAEQRILHRALSKDVGQRFATCTEFANVLGQELHSEDRSAPSEVARDTSENISPATSEQRSLPDAPRSSAGEPREPVASSGGLLGRLGRWLGGLFTGTGHPPEQPPRRALTGDDFDRVHFSVTAPEEVAPASSFVLDVWAHLEQQRAQILERARQEYGGPTRIKSKGPVLLSRGTTLTVRLRVEALIVDEPEDTILWDGEVGNASFAVRVPHDTPHGSYPALASVHVNGLRVARLVFEIVVGEATGSLRERSLKQERHRKAFLSYASPDRNQMLARVQGMQKALPEFEFFLDVLTLRSGQEWESRLRVEIPTYDVLYLFWSTHARQSKWVDKEWRCGLEARGLDFIDPVPLEPPDVAPPPEELAGKHFNDWVLAFMRQR